MCTALCSRGEGQNTKPFKVVGPQGLEVVAPAAGFVSAATVAVTGGPLAGRGGASTPSSAGASSVLELGGTT